MPFNRTGLTARDQKLVRKLVEACGHLESIFWRQSDPEALALYHSLASATSPRDVKLRTYLRINASVSISLTKINRSWAPTPMPPGRGFYPPDLTREQVEQYVKGHPEEKAAIYDQFTVVRWKDGKLEAVPYHIFYRPFLEPAAKALREAAKLSDDPAFAKFLRTASRCAPHVTITFRAIWHGLI